jgi:hypothetical protein
MTTKIEWPTEVGLSLQEYVRTQAEQKSRSTTEHEIAKITSDLVDFLDQVLSCSFFGQVQIAESGSILVDTDAEIPAEKITQVIVATVQGIDLFVSIPDA